jgi:multiple sugar transport system permease protein
MLVKPKSKQSFFWRKYAPYFFISPFFVVFLLFSAVPIFFSLYLSFQKWRQTSGLGEMRWNGLENYQFTLFNDPWFWQAVGNTLILGLMGLLIQPLALGLAVALQLGLRRMQSLITAIYFLPYITSTVAVAMAFGMLYSKNAGALNAMIGFLNGIPLLGALLPDNPIDWLGRAEYIKPAIAILVAWKFLGWNVLLILSRMQAIPSDLYEAAAIDGANTWRQFWHITLPQLKTMLFLTVTLTIIGQMQLFDEAFILVGDEGGIARSGLTVATYMYTTAFKYNEAGTGAAMAWVLFAFILILNFLNNKLFGAEARAKGD